MEIYNRLTQETLTEGEFRQSHPNTVFPGLLTKEHLEPFNCVAVLDAPAPTPGIAEIVVRDGVEEDAKGNIVQKWKIAPLFSTQEETDTYIAGLVESHKNAKLLEVDAVRAQKESGGFVFDFSDGIQGLVQTRKDKDDIRNIQAIITTGMVLQSQGVKDKTIVFRDGNDVLHALDADEAIKLGLATAAFIQDTYAWSWDKKSQINAAKTIDEVLAVEVK